MLSVEDQALMSQLMKSNPDFNHIIEKLIEENRLILSRFTHEIRNPLTLVKSTLQYIESKHPETSGFKYWDTLGSDIDETVDLLNELSIYNHCDALDSQACDLNRLLSSTNECFYALTLADSKQLTYSCEESSLDKISSVSCDATKIRQAYSNILKNAIEAAPADSTIETTVFVDSPAGSATDVPYIHITVTNPGTPIPEEELSQIFEPFVTFKHGGTGLGLSIAQKAISLHRGFITVSQTETTTSFHIQFPLLGE